MVPFNDQCLPTPKPMHTTKLILEGSAIINQLIYRFKDRYMVYMIIEATY